MFGKLLKFELKSCGKTLIPLYIATLVVSLITFMGLRISGMGFAFLFGMLAIGLIVASFVATVVIVLRRFGSSVYGTEGYFTMMLPFSAKEQLACKAVSSLIWSAAAVIVTVVSAICFLWEINFSMDINERNLIESLSPDDIGYLACSCLYYMVVTAVFLMKCYACLSVVQIRFSRNRFITGLVLFILVSYVENAIIAGLKALNLNMTEMSPVRIVYMLLWYVIFAVITWFCMDRKLNLE